jgi:hypothetical protein
MSTVRIDARRFPMHSGYSHNIYLSHSSYTYSSVLSCGGVSTMLTIPHHPFGTRITTMLYHGSAPTHTITLFTNDKLIKLSEDKLHMHSGCEKSTK